jgi:hypothetical protein
LCRGSALHQLRDQGHAAVVVDEIEEADQVRVLEPRQGLRLHPEPQPLLFVHFEVGVEPLDRGMQPDPGVVAAAPHRGHRPLPEDLFEHVLADQLHHRRGVY